MGRWTDLLLPPFLTGWGRKAATDAPAMAGGMNGAAFLGPQAADYPSARGFASMLRFGFAQNPYLYRATMYTANACAGIPWLLYDTRSTDRKEIAKHPLLTLVNAKANAREGAARHWIRTHSLLLLSGDVYLIALTNGGDMPVSELYAVRSDRMKPIMSQGTGELIEWEYSVGSTKQHYPPEVVRYLTEFSPEDENTGLAPAKVASRSVDAHNSANDWNTALLQNMARPSGMLTPSSPVVIPKDAHETLKEDLLERYSGPRNAGKPLVPRAPMDWKEMGTKPTDMDWLSGKTQAAREIAIAMAVPPELLGDSANKTYSNFGEARRSFYTETVLPRMDVLKAELNAWLLPLCGLDSERFALDYDTDDIEALQEDRQSVYDRAYKGWTAGLLTLDQSLKMIGESEVGGEMGDVRIIPSSFVTLEDAVAPPEPPPPQLLPPPAPVPGAEDDTTDAGDNPPTPPNNQQPPASNAQPPAKRSAQHAHKALTLDSEEQKAAHWNKTEKTREQWYGTVQEQVKAQLRTEHSAVMDAIAHASSAQAMQTAAERAVKQQYSNWTAVLSAVHISVGEVFAKQTVSDLEDEAKALNGRARRERKALDTIALVDSWQAHVIHWMLTGGAQKVTSITDTTRSRIQNEIAQGLAAEETIDQLAQRLDGLYLASIIPHRSETIARTEVISASNQASMFGARATGLALDKEWIATRDGRTREDHADADGQRVKLDENFTVGGVETDSPGNSGDPAQDCNCRCTEGFHVLSSAESDSTSDDEGIAA